ncbi:MAG: 16S rRNA (guanine(966)-N(2))-methyltransferase RsmD [Psychromonas sp.]|nr:16S rRNA (guanine(966)-N(2))-methyltransferase RsmD [Psychromonas sp.]
MHKNQRNKSNEKNNIHKKEGFIRLISGKWRGKKLLVKNSLGLRPTTDRTKETLFNWLMHDIQDATCLDCFSGSGSLAFEALSRFAKHVQLIEQNTSAIKQLQANALQLKATNISIVEGDCIKFLQQSTSQTYDIVFVDPPFSHDLIQPCCKLLENNGYLSDNALIYIEMESDISDLKLPKNWTLLKEKKTRQVIYQLYTHVSMPLGVISSE